MVYKYKDTITTVAGSASGNTLPLHGICKYIYIEPTTATTTYNVTITDDDNHTVKNFDLRFFKGAMRDFTEFVVQGIYTISISNATANEAFTVKMLVREL